MRSRFWIFVLLGSCLTLCAGVELLMRRGFGRISRIRHRIETQYRDVVAAGHERARPPVLVMGNSLFGQGLDIDALQAALAPDVRVQPFIFEDTGYSDWYYALRRFFAEGSRPTTVILGLSPRQLVSEHLPGDYMVHQLMTWRDVPAAGRDVDRTTLSNLVMARASLFYGARHELRKWLLSKFVRGLPELAGHFADKAPPLPSDDEIERAARPHLEALRDLCAQYGAEFVLVLPPIAIEDGAAGVERAGRAAGVRVLIPTPSRELSAANFSDGFHLNASGAQRFTHDFAGALRVMAGTPKGAKTTARLSP